MEDVMLTMPKIVYCSVVVLVLGQGKASAQTTFLSPTGKYDVHFQVLDHARYTQEQEAQGDRSHIRYEVSFVWRSTKKSRVAQMYDFYSVTKGEKPASLEALFAQITWSPGDNFAILQRLSTNGAPDEYSREVVNLNLRWNWDYSVISIDMKGKVWLDSSITVGIADVDSSRSVYLFDGRVGRDTCILEGHTPLAYEIVRIRAGNLIVRTVPDEHSDKEHRQRFRSKEIALGVRDLRRVFHVATK